MPKVEKTYYLVRLAEEQLGPPLKVGDHVVYRRESRIPWIDPIMDYEPGTRFEVLAVEYDPANSEKDHDSWDNHYFYRLSGPKGEETVDTTEVVALFDMQGESEAFVSVTEQIVGLVSSPGLVPMNAVIATVEEFFSDLTRSLPEGPKS